MPSQSSHSWSHKFSGTDKFLVYESLTGDTEVISYQEYLNSLNKGNVTLTANIEKAKVKNGNE